MILPINFLRKFEVLEKIIPKKYQLPFRYWGQKFANSLEKEMKILPEIVEPGCISIDVGANKGVYAYLLSKITKHVYCFEPITELCEYISTYNKNNISVLNMALSDQSGNLSLKIPKNKGGLVTTRASFVNTSDAFEQRDVSVEKLDAFGYKNVGFIKIDVEGVEKRVINGALNTIKLNRPVMLVEIVTCQYSYDECFDFISSITKINYVPMILRGGLQSVDIKDFCVDRSFAGNVFFIPKERL